MTAVNESGVCFSPGALALLAACWAVIQGTIVTLFWLLLKSKDTQVLKAEAREAEWARLAKRGADEIIPSLAIEVREHAQERLRGLRGPQ